MSDYQEKLYAPFVFYTRFGIGVFDRAWLEFRIRAFGAITLPSVSRVMRPGDRWVIFLDRDMPVDLLREFQELIASNPARDAVELVFVNYSFEVPDALRDRLRLVYGDSRLYLSRIDDDDAVRSDSISLFIDLALRTEGSSLFMTATSALEFFPVERIILPGRFELLVNVAFGTVDRVEAFSRQGHTALLDWAEQSGMVVARLEPSEEIFLYSRHRQSSSRFSSRRSYARNHSDSRTWRASDFRAFNLDVDRLLEFRTYAGSQPYASPGSAWSDSDKHTATAFEFWKGLVDSKSVITESRVRLLDGDSGDTA